MHVRTGEGVVVETPHASRLASKHERHVQWGRWARSTAERSGLLRRNETPWPVPAISRWAWMRATPLPSLHPTPMPSVANLSGF